MRFYLVYKNHGLYDPMPDDTEDIYVPNDLDQESNLQELGRKQIDSTEPDEYTEKSQTSKPYRPYTAGNLEDPLILNLNYKDVFPELNLEELPPQIKYKLPVSEHYDPEGKLVKRQELYDAKIRKVTKDLKDDVFQVKNEASEKEVCDKSLFEKNKTSKEHKYLNILEEETELRKIKQTALSVIEESISKAVSVANELKYKPGVRLSEPLQCKENRISSETQKQFMRTENKMFEQSNKEKVKSESKKVSFKDDYRIHETEKSSDGATKREMRVADEIKKFETFDIQMDSKINEEERKLLTQQDIDESIEAGTVRQRTRMFKPGSESTMTNKQDKMEMEPVRSDIKTKIAQSKQKAYTIGFQIIPRIRNSVQYSRQSSLILKRFILQMTNVMITLYRCIPINKRYHYTKSIQLYDRNIESDKAFRRDNMEDEPGEIRRPKLSGAKIAQIEGLKPAELTDRMNVVISEFLRKSGKEEITEKKEFHHKQTSFTNKMTDKEKYMSDTSFRENTYDENQTREEFPNGTTFRENTFYESQAGDDILNGGNTFRDQTFDHKKMFEETYETKTKSFEFREMKEEKRHTESKTKRFNANVPSYKTDAATRDNVTVPLTYIAIVEAHVYTNKNAIFEEQMRRMSGSMKQTEVKEPGIIFYRCEVSVFYRHFREPSLPPTVVIESIEEIPSEQVFEEEKQEILQTSSTVYEDNAKKLAVQKISEVIEPLLRIKEVRSVNIKQAYPALEKPLKFISEHTSVTMEKEESILQESMLLRDISRISIETPLKPVVEISEIKEEEKRGFVEILETDEHKPKPIIEPTTKSIAETTEIFIEEETVEMVDVPQPIAQLPQLVKVERPIKSVAETIEVIVDEANVEILDVSKTMTTTPRYTIADNLRTIAETMISIIAEPESESIKNMSKVTGEKVKVEVDEIIASEEFEVLPEEPMYEEVTKTETEKSILVLPEITLISAEEPFIEELVVAKSQSKEAKVDVDVKIVAEITEVSLSEREQDSFDVVTLTAKEPEKLKEETLLSIGETQAILPFEPLVEPFHAKKLIDQKASLTFEESKATETTIIQVEEPKLTFQTKENFKRQAHIEVMEMKTATVTSVSVEEPNQQIVETPKVSDKEPNTAMGASLLTVAESTIILPEGPHHGYLEIPNTEIKRPKTLIEGALIIAETSEVSPSSPEAGYNFIETINQQACVKMEESKAITTSLVHLQEPKEDNLDILQFLEKKPQASLQDSLFTVPITVEILPAGPTDEDFTTPKPVEAKADIDIEELKTASVTVVSVEEPKNETIENFTYTEKELESLLEKPILHVAEKFTTVPEGPLYDRFEPPAITCNKANIIVEEIKPLMISIVTPNEPREIAVDMPEVKYTKPQPLLEDHFLPVVETVSTVPEESKIDTYVITKTRDEKAHINLEICETAETTIVTIDEPKEVNFEVLKFEEKKPLSSTETCLFTAPVIVETIPDEPKDSFTVALLKSGQANVRIREFKGTDTTIIYLQEPKEENFTSPNVEAKQQQSVLEGIHLTAAETSLILPAESTTSFDVTKTTSLLANIKVIEQKAAEATIMLPLESKQDVIIPEIIEKTPQTLLVSPVLTAAEKYITVFEEKVDELRATIKPVARKASVYLEGLKVPLTAILSAEEPIIVFEDNAINVRQSKFIAKQAKVMIVETTATAIANVRSVVVSVAKEEIVDVSKYTVELADEHTEKDAALKVLVDFEDIDLSSVSSTISSAPSSPLIQEYVFGIATGHEYRVQSPQETSLDIIKRTKESYRVDSADTSYTLTFEAAYEEEKEVLRMEEFSDVIKNKQFWISDVKTMETVESSDARIQLMNVSIGVEGDARKGQSKSLYVKDSTVEVKSRSPSYDTSADFEVSLQSSEQSNGQISDVQVAATLDLKSEASYKTMEDVESQAKVNIKSKSAKVYTAQSVDVAYGLTIENEISQDTNIAKSSTRRVKKGAKGMVSESSEIGMEASYNHEAGIHLESSSTTKESYAAMEGRLESSTISEASYLAMEGQLESSRVSKGSFASSEANLESSTLSEANYVAVKGKLESSSDAVEASSVSESSYSVKQASIESKSKTIGMDASQKISMQRGFTETTHVDTKADGQPKLTLEIGLIGTTTRAVNDGVKSPSPEDIPSSPLRDVYIFRLHTPAPEETTFIPRDCSFTPESIHEEPIVPVKGMIPRIDTKIVRVLYSPPLDTPPSSPWRKAEPVFTKPGLKGGSETPKFTKEEILEIGRKSALLASAIDKTIRSIEEYKESVGISNKMGDTEEEGKINEKETTTESSGESKGVKSLDAEEEKAKLITADQLTGKTPRKSMQLLSRFSQI
ncbi:jg15934 [Pararge aegeria aegeria]|uniref:Jg15934 protein n=1 Tax=Pararge aegeria aegeria TaxID=348720 RepID=A0A8S4R6G7_9NEOP|nr:jg15934 [Pararge aegeria aegeria]